VATLKRQASTVYRKETKGGRFIRKTPAERAFDVFLFFAVIGIITVTLYPFWYIFMASISNPTDLIRHSGIILLPVGQPTLGAYELVLLRNPNIPMGYYNTMIYLTVGLAMNMFMTIIAAYCLSRATKLTNFFTFMVTFTMLFSGGMVPTFLLIRNLGWIDTRWAIWVPPAISVFNLIIMRTNFKSLPDSLLESARIDGASELTCLLKIMIPLSKPVIAVILLFYAVTRWNSWFPAILFLRSRSLFPLQLILREILIANDLNAFTAGAGAADREPIGLSVQYATIIVSTLPILCVYPFLQKYFVKGVMIGAVKG